MALTQDDVLRILQLIDESPMGRVALQIGDFRMEVVKGESVAASARDVGRAEPVRVAPVPAEPAAATPVAVDEGLVAVKAPILGTFYRRPQPGQPPFVEEGSLVEPETTVGLIEVMKLFNPVKAGVKGRIERICVKDNALVEFDQALFLVRPE